MTSIASVRSWLLLLLMVEISGTKADFIGAKFPCVEDNTQVFGVSHKFFCIVRARIPHCTHLHDVIFHQSPRMEYKQLQSKSLGC